jgi:hypothetical protein
MKSILEHQIYQLLPKAEELPFELEELKKFLAAASNHGYGSTVKPKISEGGVYVFPVCTEGKFEFQDQYVGGDPSLGHEWVKYEGKVVWGMRYRGITGPKGYSPLVKALQKPDPDMPVRGPWSAVFNNKNSGEKFMYKMTCRGDLLNFEGEEEIHDESGAPVHYYRFDGGLCNIL